MMMPINTNAVTWAHSLIIDFPADDVPILYNESDWKEWGNQLTLCNSFDTQGAPGVDGYDAWDKWAIEVYYAMQNF